MPTAFLGKFARIPWRKQLLLAEAACWLAVARVVLKLVSFPRIGRYLGTLRPASSLEAAAGPADPLLVRHVGWAVNTAGSHLPVEMVCLPRALAAWQMLHIRRIPSRLHFGAMKTRRTASQAPETHAWLTADGMEVTGFPEAYESVEIGYFERASALAERRGAKA